MKSKIFQKKDDNKPSAFEHDIALKDANIGQQPTVKAGPIEKKRELNSK